jgi:hypothetical protein
MKVRILNNGVFYLTLDFEICDIQVGDLLPDVLVGYHQVTNIIFLSQAKNFAVVDTEYIFEE